MATPKKISELTTAGALTGAELVPVVQNGGTLQTTTEALKIFSLGTVEYQVSVLNSRVDAVSALATQTAEAVTSINGRLPTGTIVDTTSVQTLTNKRINPRVSSTSTAVSVSPSIANHDMYFYTALQTAVSVNPPTGTPANGNKLMFRFKDNGTSRAISWVTAGTDSYRAVGVTLPLATTINKVTYVGCLYNANESFWDVIAVATQA
jgi:hypothetical protein